MKKALLLLFLLASSLTWSQDYSFLTQLEQKISKDDAVAVAGRMASLTEKQYRLYKSEYFSEYKMFVVVYAPAELTDEQIKQQGNNDNCLSVYFSDFGNDKFSFNKAILNYGDIYPVWQKLFKKEAQKNSKRDTMIDIDKGLRFALYPQNDNWIIKK
ncbi:hypothetical protein [Flavobacterium beibuense]|uniref:hypothetical protein n=1 Tax=Flavobacterium beibuense TaxID=657326 RepID=UPI003A8FA099